MLLGEPRPSMRASRARAGYDMLGGHVGRPLSIMRAVKFKKGGERRALSVEERGGEVT